VNPKSTPLSGDAFAGSGDADVLARESAADALDKSSELAPVERRNVIENWEPGKMTVCLPLR